MPMPKMLFKLLNDFLLFWNDATLQPQPSRFFYKYKRDRIFFFCFCAPSASGQICSRNRVTMGDVKLLFQAIPCKITVEAKPHKRRTANPSGGFGDKTPYRKKFVCMGISWVNRRITGNILGAYMAESSSKLFSGSTAAPLL